MLKAIELTGFKSFADKTRFEFPPGITVIVGPNGSGKSNIVDAIKWVLGEQSVKSLRGTEMTDVIFKGSSGANARKPANAATVTLILDNADQRLMSGPAELQVTRRVYRSGESEYLINNEPCRLKDIRNLFRGTGFGVDAYSLIEQGKVDRLLQANPRDRRAMFEEAAGISRFKAKKVEAERRLERVDANLTRLADIVEEVGARYRAVKNQASKATRYKEYADRLLALRTQLGVFDYRSMGERLNALQQQEHPLAERASLLQYSIQSAQVELHQMQQASDQASEALRSAHDLEAQIRADLAQYHSQRELHEQRQLDLRARLQQMAEQEKRRAAREQELMVQSDEAAAERTRLADEAAQAEQTLNACHARRAELSARAAQVQDDEARQRSALAELETRLAEARERATHARSQIAVWTQAQAKSSGQLAETSAKCESERQLVQRLQQELVRLRREAEATDSALNAAQQGVDSIQRELEQVRQRIAHLVSEWSGVRQRAEVIEELERRWEGINAGAKDLLLLSRAATSGPLKQVIGLAADLIRVHVQYAPLVDAALGNVAQYLVVDRDDFFDALEQGEIKITGRVGILSLETGTSLGADWQLELPDHPDLVGPLDSLLQCDAQHAHFVRKLLHGTWIVKSLAAARRFRQTVCDRVRYVTLDGEVVEVDGVVLAGPKAANAGIVSRRSELRALQRQAEQLQGQIDQWKQSEASLSNELVAGQTQARELLQKNQKLAGEVARLQAEIEAAAQRQVMWDQQQAAARAELEAATAGLAQAQAEWEECESRALQLGEGITNAQQRLTELVALQQQTTRESAELDIEVATVELRLNHARERLESVRQRQTEIQHQRDELIAAGQSLQRQMDDDRAAELTAAAAIQSATEQIAALQQQREDANRQIETWQTAYATVEQRRRALADQIERYRQELQQVAHERRENQMRAESLHMERAQLRQRLLDDYEIDVTIELSHTDPRLVSARHEVEQEINELRQKVQALGSINMEALAELTELEDRYLSLDRQYQDLVAAKESLTRIIQRINGDSRRLFMETLDAIRINFQKLFRLTFGGGQADLVLEEGVDVLEAGVEIVATPPGKPKFSNSLLSGGERALTAVSLLMAIFQYRPSPICVLDEVDAPFDEANIGRFIDVLKNFLSWTKFVIVTHSKKTMTAATTLYGVTMQESGVSKRVSVRFEDVSDDGHISATAIAREDEQQAAATRDNHMASPDRDASRSAVA